MGIVSSNISGAPFNGGTITSALTVDGSASDTAVPFHVIAGATNTTGVDIQVDPQTAALKIRGLDNDGKITVSNDFDTEHANFGDGFAQCYGGSITRADIDLASNTCALTVHGVLTNVHAAPADGTLAAGDLYLWFDQTNGAGKLMVKAKTANGTVATGSVTLT